MDSCGDILRSEHGDIQMGPSAERLGSELLPAVVEEFKEECQACESMRPPLQKVFESIICQCEHVRSVRRAVERFNPGIFQQPAENLPLPGFQGLRGVERVQKVEGISHMVESGDLDVHVELLEIGSRRGGFSFFSAG